MDVRITNLFFFYFFFYYYEYTIAIVTHTSKPKPHWQKRNIHASRNPVLSSDHPCLQTGEEILLLNIDIWVKQRHAAGLNGVPKKLYWHTGMYMISCFTKMKCKNVIQRFLWNTLTKHNMISWEFHLDWNFHANTQWKRRNTRKKHRTNTQRKWDGKHKQKQCNKNN